MSSKYQIGKVRKSRGRKIVGALITAVLIVGVLGGILAWDTIRGSQPEEVMGASRSVPQAAEVEEQTKAAISEPLFGFDLPPDWKQKGKVNSPTEQSITWQATKKGEDNRWLTIYIDTIPANLAVNRLLPVNVLEDGLNYEQISENCTNFTPVTNPVNKQPTPSKWQGVDFICDIPNFVQNKVGVSVAGALNSIVLTGQTKGKHKYFMIYTDHNIQPDYTILYNAIKTFRVK